MADFRIAIDFVMEQEDRGLSGKVTTDTGDRGGPTRFGLSSSAHPELAKLGFFDTSRVAHAAALEMAVNAYASSYAAPLHILELKDQAVATALLSFGVNAGYTHAALALQHAALKCGSSLAADGILGSASVAALNELAPDSLLVGFTAEVKTYYRQVTVANPSQLRFLKGWLNRADAWVRSAAELRRQAR